MVGCLVDHMLLGEKKIFKRSLNGGKITLG